MANTLCKAERKSLSIKWPWPYSVALIQLVLDPRTHHICFRELKRASHSMGAKWISKNLATCLFRITYIIQLPMERGGLVSFCSNNALAVTPHVSSAPSEKSTRAISSRSRRMLEMENAAEHQPVPSGCAFCGAPLSPVRTPLRPAKYFRDFKYFISDIW